MGIQKSLRIAGKILAGQQNLEVLKTSKNQFPVLPKADRVQKMILKD